MTAPGRMACRNTASGTMENGFTVTGSQERGTVALGGEASIATGNGMAVASTGTRTRHGSRSGRMESGLTEYGRTVTGALVRTRTDGNARILQTSGAKKMGMESCENEKTSHI